MSSTQFGEDLRRSFAAEQVQGHRFVAKLAVAGALLALGAALLLSGHPAGIVAGMAVLGLMYTHLSELQHETLHNLAFSTRPVNEIVGVLLGIPMLVSYADYQASHLRHHRYLGTDRNTEYFDYGIQYGAPGVPLRRVRTLFVRFLMPQQYRHFTSNLWRAMRGRPIPGEDEATSARIRRDHLIIGGALAVAAVLAVLGYPLVLLGWLVPLALVSYPVHALIELPEHYWCDTDARDPFANTRTVETNWVVRWFVNANNLHVEHHLMPRLPFRCLPALHRQVAGQLIHHGRYPGLLRTLLGPPPAPDERPESSERRN